MSRYNRLSSGDTIVEVLLAMTLLSAILFTSWAIVNRSSQISLAARQRIAIVNQLKEQAEIIQDMYSDPATKSQVLNRQFGAATAKNFATSANVHANPCDSSRGSDGLTNSANPVNGFHFDSSAVVSTSYQPKSVVGYESAKIWIQMGQGSGYIDFYIRGCWAAPGGGQQEDNTQLIMRLNT